MRTTLTLAGCTLLVLATSGCSIDIGGPGPATDITFVQDPGVPAGAHLELDGFELFSDGGIGVETQQMEAIASVSYTLSWDPAVATFTGGRSTPLGGLPEESTFTAEQVSPGLLKVRHELVPGASGALGGLLHIIELEACASCAGESGVFVQDIVVRNTAGQTVPAGARTGKVVVTRLR